MNWYKQAQMTLDEFGNSHFKWARGWGCSVKKEKDGLYWASLKYNGNFIQSFPGHYQTQARTAAFRWLERYLKTEKPK
jgi:hypothetical protein